MENTDHASKRFLPYLPNLAGMAQENTVNNKSIALLIESMLADWDVLSPSQKENALQVAAILAEREQARRLAAHAQEDLTPDGRYMS